MLISRTLAITALISTCSLAAAPEDWPKWLGPRGDNISREQIADSWPDDGPQPLWDVPVGEGHSSPIAKDGKIYLFTLDGPKTERLTCFNADDGQVVWKQEYTLTGRAPQYPGTRATPTIDGDRIYTLGQSGDLTCRELADGKPLWQTNVLKETGAKMLPWGCASSPLIVDDRIFVQTGEGGPIAVAVNKTDGKVIWKAQDKSKAGYASLVYADLEGQPQLIIFAGRALGGLDPKTGKTIWSDKFETRYDVNAATPIFHEGRVLFTAEYDTGRAAMYELSPKGGTKVWENRNLKSKFQPPILDSGYVYGNNGGNVVCIAWGTGELAWEAKDRNMRLGAGGSLLRADGDKLITLSERGKLSLIRATPKGYKPLGQMDLFDADQIWASPLLYGGKLYCKGRDELVCLDVSAK